MLEYDQDTTVNTNPPMRIRRILTDDEDTNAANDVNLTIDA